MTSNRKSSLVPLALSLMFTLIVGQQVVVAQSAPQITDVQATKVRSQRQTSWEAVAPAQTQTVRDHGGTFLEVGTKEIGYASVRVATFNGVSMRQVSSSPIVVGNRTVGYNRVWRLDRSFTSGQFVYRVVSSNFPFTARQDSIYIR